MRRHNKERTYYKNNSLLKAKPYEGIFDLFNLLNKNKVKIAIATYKREDYALELLKAFNFDYYYQVMHSADNDNKLTKADIIRRCMYDLNAQVHETVYVGDTMGDYKASKEVGIDFLGVTYGFGLSMKNIYEFPTAQNTEDILNVLGMNLVELASWRGGN